MKLGLWLAMIGGVLVVGALSVMPWQGFVLADATATGLELGAYGVFMLLAALAVVGAAGWGLATGRRKPASLAVAGLGFGLGVGLVVARANAVMGLDLMAHEEISVELGYLVALLASAFVVGGALFTRSTLVTWDETSPLLRVAIMARDEEGGRRVVVDQTIYEPQTLALRALLAGHDVDCALPTVVVTPEGDASLRGVEGLRVRATRGDAPVAFAGAIALGDHVVVACGALEVVLAHTAPVTGGRVATRNLSRAELWSFGAAACVGLVVAAVVPLMTWTEEAVLGSFCGAGMCAGVVAKTEPDAPDLVVDLDTIEPTAIEEPELSSKAIGGPEGKLGDPTVTQPRENIVPKIDAPLVAKVDPRMLGINALIDRELATTSTVAEIFRGDVAATTNRIAAAMEGEGNQFVLGPGTGLGFEGNDNGGPGTDGPGRLMGLGEIDEGGPGVRVKLGEPPKKRKVAVIDHGPTSQNGYCKASNIQSVVMRRAGAIRACYETQLQVKSALAGKLTVRWTIGSEGSVTNVSSVADSIGDSATTRCVMDWVRRMKFEAPEQGLCVVQWPFVFSGGK